MRNGLKVLLAVAMAAGVAACDTGDDDIELYEGEEAATPALEPTQPGMETAILTAQFEPTEQAQGQQISGTVRILPARDGTVGTTAPTDRPATTDQTATDAEARTGTGMDATTTAPVQGFQVEVMLTGLSEGEHAWHIHRGTCDEGGPVEVAFSETANEDGLADNLEADDTGRVQSTADVPADELTLERLQSGQFSLNVHQSGGEDHGPAIACADLSGQNNTTM